MVFLLADFSKMKINEKPKIANKLAAIICVFPEKSQGNTFLEAKTISLSRTILEETTSFQGHILDRDPIIIIPRRKKKELFDF